LPLYLSSFSRHQAAIRQPAARFHVIFPPAAEFCTALAPAKACSYIRRNRADRL